MSIVDLWDDDCENAWKSLVKAVSEAGVLHAPHPTAEFVVTTDASNLAMGGIVSQLVDGELRTIGHWSRLLRGPEVRYPTHEKELFAIVSCLKAYAHLLQGRNQGSLRS